MIVLIRGFDVVLTDSEIFGQIQQKQLPATFLHKKSNAGRVGLIDRLLCKLFHHLAISTVATCQR